MATPPPTATPTAVVPSYLAYSHDVKWQDDAIPGLAPMEGTIQSILAQLHVAYLGVDGDTVDGFYPGSTYEYFPRGGIPFFFYARDTATVVPMARYFYGPNALRSTVDEFLREQYPDGSISATINPSFSVDKATTTSDEETSLILTAAESYDAFPDPAWLGKSLRGQSIIQRLNGAMQWLMTTRMDPGTGLIERGDTTDWGDVKWETDGDPVHQTPDDPWTVSIYDQSIAYAALQALAGLNAAANRPDDAQHWLDAATQLRANTDATLWQNDLGYYLLHQYVPPAVDPHSIDETQIVSIGNAAAVYYGLATPDKVPSILNALETARVTAGAPKPGLSLTPPYPGWPDPQMAPYAYQNGALWDWWAGRQITGEFRSGHWDFGQQHMAEMATDWASHPGTVREWESPWLGRTGDEQAYGGAAAAVGQSIVDGLFGIEMHGTQVHLTPRLGVGSGSIHVYEPVEDLYAAYQYQADATHVSFAYGSNSPVALQVTLPIPWDNSAVVTLDQSSRLPVVVGTSPGFPLVTVTVPSGVHRIDVVPGP